MKLGTIQTGDSFAHHPTRKSTPAWLGRAKSALTLACMLASALGAQAQCLITDFEGGNPLLNGRYLFRFPSFSGSTAAFVDPAGNTSTVSYDRAHSGYSSLKVNWKSTPDPRNWLRLTTFRNGAVLAVNPNPQLRSSDILSFWIYVPSGTPDFYLSIGVRETGFYTGCGQDGGTVGGIEWLGATTRRSPGGPIGKLVSAKDQWVQVYFAVPCEPVLNFFGNGVLNTSELVFEHLAITPVTPGEVGPFVMYLDDFAVEPFPMVEFLSPVTQLDAPHTFAVGETVPVSVRLRGCDGGSVADNVTVKLGVKGLLWDYWVYQDVDEVANGIGDSINKTFQRVDDHFQFNLATFGYDRGTSLDYRSYQAQVVVTENTHGVEVGRGSIMLESK